MRIVAGGLNPCASIDRSRSARQKARPGLWGCAAGPENEGCAGGGWARVSLLGGETERSSCELEAGQANGRQAGRQDAGRYVEEERGGIRCDDCARQIKNRDRCLRGRKREVGRECLALRGGWRSSPAGEQQAGRRPELGSSRLQERGGQTGERREEREGRVVRCWSVRRCSPYLSSAQGMSMACGRRGGEGEGNLERARGWKGVVGWKRAVGLLGTVGGVPCDWSRAQRCVLQPPGQRRAQRCRAAAGSSRSRGGGGMENAPIDEA